MKKNLLIGGLLALALTPLLANAQYNTYAYNPQTTSWQIGAAPVVSSGNGVFGSLVNTLFGTGAYENNLTNNASYVQPYNSYSGSSYNTVYTNTYPINYTYPVTPSYPVGYTDGSYSRNNNWNYNRGYNNSNYHNTYNNSWGRTQSCHYEATGRTIYTYGGGQQEVRYVCY